MAKYKIETRKEYGSYAWSNTWAVEADTQAAAISAGNLLCTFEAAILNSNATIIEHKVSSWPNPSNQNFVITSQQLPGQRSFSNPEPAEMCLLANINAVVGHKGKKWLRMCLDEGDVTLGNAMPLLAPSSALPALFVAAAGDLDDDLTTLGVTLVIGTNPVSARNSTNLLVIGGVGFRDTDVGWYNRQP